MKSFCRGYTLKNYTQLNLHLLSYCKLLKVFLRWRCK